MRPSGATDAGPGLVRTLLPPGPPATGFVIPQNVPPACPFRGRVKPETPCTAMDLLIRLPFGDPLRPIAVAAKPQFTTTKSTTGTTCRVPRCLAHPIQPLDGYPSAANRPFSLTKNRCIEKGIWADFTEMAGLPGESRLVLPEALLKARVVLTPLLWMVGGGGTPMQERSGGG